MTQKGLSADRIADYERDGYLAPIDIYTEAEMAEFRRRLEDFQARHPEGTRKIDLKAHLVCPWLEEMVHNPKFVDVVESLFHTSDILCTTSSFRFKKPNSPTFAAWHQDTMYIKIEPAVTFWLAFTEMTPANGGMRVIPGSHKGPLLPHEDTKDNASILTRGQRITAPVDDAKAVSVSLRPGQAAIFHHNAIHGSGANTTGDWRILFLPSYVPAYAVNRGPRECAAVVRGEDRYHNFDHEPRCPGEMTPEAIKAHRAAVEYSVATMYRGAEHKPVALS